MDNDIGVNLNKNLIDKNSVGNQRKIIYLLIFLFTLHFTPATYIESTFIESLVGDKGVGLIYSITSIFTIIGLIIARKIIRYKGNFKTFITVLILELISLGILSLSMFADKTFLSTFIFIIAFIVGFISRSIAFLNFDIFIEKLSNDKETGSIRGGFLTSLNFAFVIGPIVAGLIAKDVEDLGKIFFLGILILIPVIYLSFIYFKDFEDSKYQKFPIWETIFYVIRKKDLRNIMVCNFLLFFFYSWMIIYTPIFLRETIGFNLSEIGIIIGIALIPFLLLQYYLGKIADEKYGEKEILSIGFVVAGLSTMLMSIFSVDLLILWVIILFITRIGASMIESMVETYLFKKVSDQNVDIIGLFRATRPIAYIISPVIASFFLLFTSINFLFFILGLILLFGLNFSLRITDTR
jgi:MFS family permease